jgi:hypothetical protein
MTKRVVLFTVVLALPALGYIEALSSLKGVIQESDVIARGTVDAVSVEKKAMILRVGKVIKGKCVYERIKIDLSAGEKWHPEAALRHAVKGSPVDIFYHKVENSDKAAIALIYVNRFFMTVQGDDEFWRFSKIELAMNRVFHGTSEELGDLVFKVLSGRIRAPGPKTQLRPYTKEILDSLPPPPLAGEKWAEFDSEKAFTLEKTFAPDPEGFLQYWLLAGPFPAELEMRWPEGTPKEGEAFYQIPWKAHQAVEFSVDLAAFASESGKDAAKSVFAGATYLFCEQDLPDVVLAVGSDEGSRWMLNGQPVAKVESPKAFAKDLARSAPLALKKGRNVLIMMVDNKANPCQMCARFLDKEGKPVRAIVNDSSPR